LEENVAKIVAVDDDPAGQRLIKYMLSSAGHEIVTASNGIQGLQLVNNQLPELVILDVMLPGIDGFEVCRRIRTGASTKKIPVIMVSGKTQASDRETAVKMGANEYLVKPVERQKLIEVVSDLLSVKEASVTQKANVIAFIGARGGAGTSTVSLNVTAALVNQGKSSLLVDMTPVYSPVGELLGLRADSSIAGLFKNASGTLDGEKVRGAIEKHRSGISLLWAETTPDEAAGYTPANVKALFRELRETSEFIITDIPASPSENSIAALMLADFVMLVAGAGRESLLRIDNAAARLAKFGISREKIMLVLVDKTEDTLNDDLLNKTTINGLTIAGKVRYCAAECVQAEEQGIPVVISAPDSIISKDIQQLTSTIIQMVIQS
jgi:DNA-binding response OmpR family regulator